MKLQQGQTWQKGDEFYRIVTLERLSVAYKTMQDLTNRVGPHNEVTKKEFCRLIKGAKLVTGKELPAPASLPSPASAPAPAPTSDKPL